MNKFAPFFREFYYQKLITPSGTNPVRDRAVSLQKVFEILDSRNANFTRILETGTMRADHGDFNFGGDGCATFIFDKYVNICGGSVTSVDISPENCDYSRSKVSGKTEIICSDSVKYISGIDPSIKFDLIYLDSFDITQANPGPSQQHHLAEYLAVIKNTKPGTLLVIDDHDAFFTGGKIGKGNMVKEHLDALPPIHEGYQIIWQL